MKIKFKRPMDNTLKIDAMILFDQYQTRRNGGYQIIYSKEKFEAVLSTQREALILVLTYGIKISDNEFLPSIQSEEEHKLKIKINSIIDTELKEYCIKNTESIIVERMKAIYAWEFREIVKSIIPVYDFDTLIKFRNECISHEIHDTIKEHESNGHVITDNDMVAYKKEAYRMELETMAEIQSEVKKETNSQNRPRIAFYTTNIKRYVETLEVLIKPESKSFINLKGNESDNKTDSTPPVIFICDNELMVKIYNLCFEYKIFKCEFIEFLKCVKAGNFDKIESNLEKKLRHLIFKLQKPLGKDWYKKTCENYGMEPRRFGGLRIDINNDQWADKLDDILEKHQKLSK